jgi:5-methylcytosine-specific restriction endonuclease McrA
MVHHKIPLTWCLIYYAALALASINLVSLCDQCHEKMYNRITHRLTAIGLAWVKRMGQIGLDWINKYGEDEW